LKGKTKVRIHNNVQGKLFGRTFWAWGYCLNTEGLNEHEIQQYFRDQEKLQKEQNQREVEFTKRSLLSYSPLHTFKSFFCYL